MSLGIIENLKKKIESKGLLTGLGQGKLLGGQLGQGKILNFQGGIIGEPGKRIPPAVWEKMPEGLKARKIQLDAVRPFILKGLLEKETGTTTKRGTVNTETKTKGEDLSTKRGTL